MGKHTEPGRVGGTTGRVGGARGAVWNTKTEHEHPRPSDIRAAHPASRHTMGRSAVVGADESEAQESAETCRH